MPEHCANFDGSNELCLRCPGKVNVVRRDGSVEEICRAGETLVRQLVATGDNRLPVYPIPFPADEPRRPA